MFGERPFRRPRSMAAKAATFTRHPWEAASACCVARRRDAGDKGQPEGEGAAEVAPEVGSFNAATLVPEPAGLQSFSSFTFSPGRAEQEAGHPLVPSAPSHKSWIKRLDNTLAAWERSPSHLEVGILSRREDLDEKMAHEERRSRRSRNVATKLLDCFRLP
ncbi:unnamed protein product [Polarella glacialis]|uniref:Uncharacterized protein n=1 Tax=Polarella glacialis TaxID=89957 RepID=A0A813EIW3_POLGL|nr:unnamed protein product [Polarella glacialis]